MSEEAATEQPVIAAAITVANGRVLLARRRVAEGALSWQFPAGAVEPGESPEEAAVREAYEETRLNVEAVQRLGERVHPATGRMVVYVACNVVAGTAEVGDPDELAEVAWADRAGLSGYVPYPFYGPVLEYFDATLT